MKVGDRVHVHAVAYRLKRSGNTAHTSHVDALRYGRAECPAWREEGYVTSGGGFEDPPFLMSARRVPLYEVALDQDDRDRLGRARIVLVHEPDLEVLI